MTTRQKAGLSLFATGVVSVVVGVVALTTSTTPQWLDMCVVAVGVVLKSLGFVVNFPSNTNPQ